MAVLNLGSGSGGDKENAPPQAPAARGIGVKSQAVMKRPGSGGKAARKRPPLRDITGFVLAAACRPPPELPRAAAALPVAEGARAASDVAAARQGRYSLRMAFR